MGVTFFLLGDEIAKYFESMLKFYNIKYKKINKVLSGLGIGIFISILLYFNVSCIINISKTNEKLANVVGQLELGYKDIDKNSIIELQSKSDGRFTYNVSSNGVNFFVTIKEDGSEDTGNMHQIYYYYASYDVNTNTGVVRHSYTDRDKKFTIYDIEKDFQEVHSVRKRYPFFYQKQQLSNINIKFSDEMMSQLQSLERINKEWENKYKINIADNKVVEVTEIIRYRKTDLSDATGFLNIDYILNYRNAYQSEMKEKQ